MASMATAGDRVKSRNLIERSFEFAVRIIKLCDWLDGRRGVSRRLADQLLRAGTSVGANVEEGQGAETPKDFAHKYAIALKEARETNYWLRLLLRAQVVPPARLKNLLQESIEVKLMLGAAVRTAKSRTAGKAADRRT